MEKQTKQNQISNYEFLIYMIESKKQDLKTAELELSFARKWSIYYLDKICSIKHEVNSPNYLKEWKEYHKEIVELDDQRYDLIDTIDSLKEQIAELETKLKNMKS